MGPYIVTKDELPLPGNVNIVYKKLTMKLDKMVTLAEMILKIDELIEEISKYMLHYIREILLQLVHQQALVQVCNHLNSYNQVMKLKVTIDNIGTLDNLYR